MRTVFGSLAQLLIRKSLFFLIVGSNLAAFAGGMLVNHLSVLEAQGGPAVVSGGGAGRNALTFNGNILEFRSIDGQTIPPTVYGMLMPPDAQPTHPSQHRAMWTWCTSDGVQLVCEDRMNVNGNILKRGAVTWNLPQ